MVVLEAFTTSASSAKEATQTIQTEWVANIQNLRDYVEEQFNSENFKSPTPPASDPNSELQEIWEAIFKLRATTRQQAAVSSPSPPIPDSQITVLIGKMVGNCAEVKDLQAAISYSGASPLLVKEEGCCPGNKGELWGSCPPVPKVCPGLYPGTSCKGLSFSS
ncbi:hypothetical protein DSO57_1035662 [Entomophthora muscae]|uniref:Uncharacterized protein n=1 Tax=Entomophthora muscae TaxID=34485 RepID=A0ACC2RE66_9FUNG|nr:hypothetical protein DSO57_1035662 [Entomophthora muscae]